MSIKAYALEVVKELPYAAPGATSPWWMQYFDNPLNSILGILTVILVVLRIYYIIKTGGKGG